MLFQEIRELRAYAYYAYGNCLMPSAKYTSDPTAYMFGPALMVCPVGHYKMRSRDVYFPAACGWYDFYSGKYFDGGQTLKVDAPYEKIPLFVRSGSIIPFGPDLQYSDEKKPELITLFVYEGANGDFQLYEDEGTNYNYEKGKYATIDFSYNDATKTFIIGDRKGSFDGMLNNRRFNVITVSRDNSQPFDLNAKGKLVTYSGKKLIVRL